MNRVSFLGGDLGYRSDASAAVRVDVRGDLFVVAEVKEWRPTKDTALVPSAVRAGMIEMAKSATISEIALDLFGVEDAREQFGNAGISIFELPNGQGGKLATHQVAKELLHARRVRFSAAQRRLVTQVKAIISKPTSGGGVSISSPRTSVGHGDAASAFIAALYLAHLRTQGSAEFVDADINPSAKSRWADYNDFWSSRGFG